MTHPLSTRIGLLIPTPAAQVVWTGTAAGAQSAAFVLAVETISGPLTNGTAGMVAVTADGDYIRLKADGATDILYLAENYTEFEAGDALTVYNIRLPFPRYQRLDGTTLYKDWDVAFPANFRHVLPPAVVITPEVVWTAVGTHITLDGAGTVQVYDPAGTASVSLAWSAGAWGTVHSTWGTNPTNRYAEVSAGSAGWHYLKITATDAEGGVSLRYVPFIAGGTPINVLSCDLTWALEKGWEARGTADGEFAYLEHTPAALVDLDSKAILFWGFLHPGSISRDLTVETFEFQLLSPLAEADKLTTHAFIVTDLADAETPDAWEEVRKLTIERAVWYLLVWQTCLPQITNIRLKDVTARRIKGQKFQAGSLTALIQEVLGAAQYVLRGQRTGGVVVAGNPLFAQAGTWGGADYLSLDISGGPDTESAIELDRPEWRFSDCVLSGVFLTYAGDYTPARMRAPAHPAAWGGRTATLDRLAPLESNELREWAERYFVNENRTPRLTVRSTITVDPGTYALVYTGVPEALQIAIESLREQFNVGGLFWSLQISGRPYISPTFLGVAAPLPDPIVVEPSPSPDPDPPIPFVPPYVEQLWPTRVYVATKLDGVFYTNTFGGPDDAMPTWTRLNALSGSGYLTTCDGLHVVPGGAYQYVITERNADDAKVYRRTSGDWYEILDAATFKATYAWASGWSTARFSWITSYGSTLYVMMTAGSSGMKLIQSTDYGDTWSLLANISGWAYSSGAGAGNFIIEAGAGYMVVNRAGGGAGGTYYYSNAGMTAWTDTASEYGGSNYHTGMHRINGESYLHAYLSNGGTYERLLRRYDDGLSPPFYTPAASDWEMINVDLADGWPFMVYVGGVEYLIPRATYAAPNRLLSSADGWETKTTPAAAIGRIINAIYSSPYVGTNFILGRASDTATNVDPHHIYVSAAGDGITDRSGDHAANPTTTDSIPYDCGGICANGIGIVE